MEKGFCRQSTERKIDCRIEIKGLLAKEKKVVFKKENWIERAF